MLDEGKRQMIFGLRAEGHGIRWIGRVVGASRNAVRRILAAKSTEPPKLVRDEVIRPHAERVGELLKMCDGNLVRVHEERQEAPRKEAGAVPPRPVAYSTLTAFCRRHHLVEDEPSEPSGRYHFLPGEEFQHDTSPCGVWIAGKKHVLQIAAIVECHSGFVYVQAFPHWRRFHCRSFLSEALQVLGGVPRRCMVDNSSVVVARGTGANAVIAPEMVSFADRFGFRFAAHEKGDANRSARVERLFDHVQRNALSGRRFPSESEFNAFLRAWGDKQNRTGKRRLEGQSPAEILAENRRFLRPLPAFLPEEILVHQRTVDTEAMVHLERNSYSVPAAFLGRRVQVQQSRQRIRIFCGHRLVADHPAEVAGARKRAVLPEHRKQRRHEGETLPVIHEERVLAASGPTLARLVGALRKMHGSRVLPYLRRLYRFFLDYPTEVLEEAVGKALSFGLTDLERIERIVLRTLSDDFFRLSFDVENLEDDDDAEHLGRGNHGQP